MPGSSVSGSAWCWMHRHGAARNTLHVAGRGAGCHLHRASGIIPQFPAATWNRGHPLGNASGDGGCHSHNWSHHPVKRIALPDQDPSLSGQPSVRPFLSNLCSIAARRRANATWASRSSVPSGDVMSGPICWPMPQHRQQIFPSILALVPQPSGFHFQAHTGNPEPDGEQQAPKNPSGEGNRHFLPL